MRTTVLRLLAALAVLAVAVAVGLRLGERGGGDAPAAAPLLQVTLRLSDPEGDPVAGAWVAISRLRGGRPRRAGGGPADARGVARFDLPPGAYLLRASAEGLASEDLRIDLAAADVERALPMDRTFVLAGTVLGAPEVEVSVRGPGPASRTVRTGADGAFSVPDLRWAPGLRYLVDVQAPPGFWRPPAGRRLVRPGAEAVRTGRVEVETVRLLRRGRITGRLTGSRAGEAVIRMTDHRTRDPRVDLPGESWMNVARPDPDGRFLVVNVPPGTLEAYLVVEGGHADLPRIPVGAGEALDLGEIEVPESFPGSVAGRVELPSGDPRVRGVRLLSDRGFRQIGEDGSFRIEGIAGDEVTLVAGARGEDGWMAIRERVEVGRADLVFRPEPAGRIRFELRDDRTGERITEAPAAVVVGDPPLPASGFTYFAAALWTRPLPPGVHPVTLRVKGYEDARLPRVTVHADRESRVALRLTPLP